MEGKRERACVKRQRWIRNTQRERERERERGKRDERKRRDERGRGKR
jgi:hypothetical protein